MRSLRISVPCLLGALLSTAAAQFPEPALIQRAGDPLPTGEVTLAFEELAVVTGDSDVTSPTPRQWLVEATLQGMPDFDAILLDPVNLQLIIQEGDPVAQPLGATISRFRSININADSTFGWIFDVDTTAGGTSSGLYIDGHPILIEGDASAALPPGSTYESFSSVHYNDAGNLLALARADVAGGGPNDDLLARIDTDLVGGDPVVTGETVVVRSRASTSTGSSTGRTA